jgi:diguanylate cyclase (GGDEF)-like protein/PAS domain S-box-containing protein
MGGSRLTAERRRLVALADYARLEPARRTRFSGVVNVISHFLDVPVAAVGFVDDGRIRFAARIGIDVDHLPRNWGLTDRVLAGDGVVVADTPVDRGFVHHPLGSTPLGSTEGPLRAWAAAPLLTPDGLVVGALYVADRRPRQFTANQLAVFHGLARLVMAELEAWRQRHGPEDGDPWAGAARDFDSLLRDPADTVVVIDSDGDVAYCSPALRELLGYGAEPVATAGSQLVHPDDLPVLVTTITTAITRSGTSGPVEFRLVNGDGSYRAMEAVFTNCLDDPAVRGVAAYLRDVSARQRAMSLLTAEARLLERIARGAPLGELLGNVVALLEDHMPGARAVVRRFDREHRVLRVAAAPNLPEAFVAAVAEWPLDAMATPFVAAARAGEPVIIEHISGAGGLDITYRLLTAGHRLQSTWAIPVISTGNEELLGTVGVYRPNEGRPTHDDERLLELAARLTGLAFEHHDDPARHGGHGSEVLVPRTQLVRRLDDALARAAGVGGKLAVLLLDLDRFKEVNEGFGHAAGDMVLPLVGRRLAQAVRPADVVVRVAGDEFVVVCEGLVGELEAVGVAERIHAALREPVRIRRSELHLTASIGIAMTHGDGDHAESLLRDADAALYQAKQRGRARFELFNGARRREAQDRRQLEAELEHAIDSGELRVWLQPEIALPGETLLGFEALVRWEHPKRGLLGPAEFIPHAERSGLIDRLGEWVLEHACQFARGWRDEHPGMPMVVSVNVSARQLADPLLADRVADALEMTGLAPEELCLELTESALMDDADLSLAALRALKALGVQLAIDDFGTGYSSLAYLRRFPIDAVKIDRSFVSGLGSRSEDSAIVTAVLGLTQALGLNAIAEGVEDVGQRDELVRLGCGAAQGFLFSPPRPAHELPAY